VVVVLRTRDDLLVDELAHHLGDRPLLVGPVEKLWGYGHLIDSLIGFDPGRISFASMYVGDGVPPALGTLGGGEAASI
jgi:hypothetical protein